MHRCDARAKILLLLAFSITIFFAGRWWQIGLFGAAAIACIIVARIPLRKVVLPMIPVIALALFAVAFAFAGNPTVEGFSSGALVGTRMIVLVAASFVVCLTSSPDDLLEGFSRLISPLRAIRVPVDDVAFMLALALRFIPVIAEETLHVRAAQKARGGDVASLGFWRSLGVWGAAFSAVFIGLFRHADALADAMDARCYGMRR